MIVEIEAASGQQDFVKGLYQPAFEPQGQLVAGKIPGLGLDGVNPAVGAGPGYHHPQVCLKEGKFDGPRLIERKSPERLYQGMAVVEPPFMFYEGLGFLEPVGDQYAGRNGLHSKLEPARAVLYDLEGGEVLLADPALYGYLSGIVMPVNRVVMIGFIVDDVGYLPVGVVAPVVAEVDNPLTIGYAGVGKPLDEE